MQKYNDIYTIEVSVRNNEGGMDTYIGAPLTEFIWCDDTDLSLNTIKHISVSPPGFFERFYKNSKHYRITLVNGNELQSQKVTGNIILQVAGINQEVIIDPVDLVNLNRRYY